ncbi:MAG: hypothetical protein LWY06_00825 [Firmicutes bacterium]|nr:hypothetical protein [Bacillota bacterium]
MIYYDNRQMLIGILEEYMDGKTDADGFFVKIYDFEEDFADSRTLKVLTSELILSSKERPCFAESRTSWDLWQRLLLILKSGADLYESYVETEKGCGPFRDFKQIRKAYNRSEGFRKRRFEGFYEMPQDKKISLGCMIIGVLFLIVAICALVYLSPLLFAMILFSIFLKPYPIELLHSDGNSNYTVKFSN